MPNEAMQKLRAKYPQYKGVDDTTLAQKIVAKYPQYGEAFAEYLQSPSPTQEPAPESSIYQRKITEAITEPIGSIARAITGKPASSVMDVVLGAPGRAAVAGSQEFDKMKEAVKAGRPLETVLRGLTTAAEVGMGAISPLPVVAGIGLAQQGISQASPEAGRVVEKVMTAPSAAREYVAPDIKPSSTEEAGLKLADLAWQFALFGLGNKGAMKVRERFLKGEPVPTAELQGIQEGIAQSLKEAKDQATRDRIVAEAKVLDQRLAEMKPYEEPPTIIRGGEPTPVAEPKGLIQSRPIPEAQRQMWYLNEVDRALFPYEEKPRSRIIQPSVTGTAPRTREVIPEFRSTEEAIEYGKGNPAVIPDLERRAQEADIAVRSFIKAKNYPEAMTEALRGQLAREAISYAKDPEQLTPLEKERNRRIGEPLPKSEETGLKGTDPKPDYDPAKLDPEKLKNFQTLLDEVGVGLKVRGPDGTTLSKTSIKGAIEDWQHDKGREFSWRAQSLFKALDDAFDTGIVEVRPGTGQPHVEVKTEDLIANRLEREGIQGEGVAKPAKVAEKQPWEMTREEYAGTTKEPAGGSQDYVDAWLSDYKKGNPGITQELKRPDGSGILVYRNQIGEPVAFLHYDPKSVTDIGSRNAPLTATRELLERVYSQGIRGAKKPFSKAGAMLLHRFSVEKARSEGKPIPQEVLKEYPDLQSEAIKETPSQSPIEQLKDFAKQQPDEETFVREVTSRVMPRQLSQVLELKDPLELDGKLKELYRSTKGVSSKGELVRTKSKAPLARKDIDTLRREQQPLSSYDAQSQAEWLGKGTRFAMPIPQSRNIKVYRATPEGYGIADGDYVTTNRKYAEEHIRNNLSGKGKITERMVGLDEIYPADAPNEFWFARKPSRAGTTPKGEPAYEVKTGEQVVPQRPLVNPKATALKQDEQLRAQQRWDAKYGVEIGRKRQEILKNESKDRRREVLQSRLKRGETVPPKLLDEFRTEAWTNEQANMFKGHGEPAYQAKVPQGKAFRETKGKPDFGLFEKPKKESGQGTLLSLSSIAASQGVDYLPVDDDTKKRLKVILGVGGMIGLVTALSPTGKALLASVEQAAKRAGKPLSVMMGEALKSGEVKELGVKDLEQFKKIANNPAVNRIENEISRVAKEQKSIQGVEENLKYAFNINKDRLNITPADKTKLDATVNRIKPQLEKEKGKPLTNEEVIEAAQTSDLLRRAISREQTEKINAAILKTRQAVAAGAQDKGTTRQFIDNIRILNTYAANAGRTLQKFSINADPSLANIKESVIKKLVSLGVETDKILKASEGVDFNNPKTVAKFYREFVKPDWKELIDEYRYINLLSSPKTHIVNMFSNLLQGGVIAPVTKLYQGGIDFVGSTLTGKERNVYVRSVPVYYKGLLRALPEAVKNAFSVMKGETFTLRPDLENLPSMGESASPLLKPVAKFNQALRPITNTLEAADIFLQTMIRSGEREAISYSRTRQGKSLDNAIIEEEATNRAKEYLFRAELDPDNLTGQGKLLSWIDKGATVAYKFRSTPIIGWTVPFIRTPMNILKQGIEYSPAGLTTLIGSTHKQAQLAKAMVGSTVFAGAAAIVASNESTWEAPKSPNEKEKFYQSGRQPYSIKFGDTWVSYSKLGVLAYPIALAAAIKYHTTQSKQSQDASALQKIESILGSQAKFFADQSYVQGVSDIIDAVSSGENYQIDKLFTNLPSQLIPLVSLQSWVGNLIDPVYRKPKGFIEGMAMKTPFTRQFVPVSDESKKEKVLGLPREMVNALSPMQMSVDVTATPVYTPKKGRSGSANPVDYNKLYNDTYKKQTYKYPY